MRFLMETEVARGEVEFLIIGRVVGNVHLAILASNGAVAFDDNGCVVVESCGTSFEEGGDEDNAQLLCQFSVSFGGRAWNAFGKVEAIRILRLAEIERIVKLLQHDQFCSLSGSFSDACFHVQEVLFDFLHTFVLYDAYFHGKNDFFLQR